MAKKIRVALIFGGRSGEHEVSLRSGRSVWEALDRKKFDVVPVAIAKSGQFLSPNQTTELFLKGAAAETDGAKVSLVRSDSNKSIAQIETADDNALAQPIDVVLPVLHGTYGEDGTIQGMLEMLGIPYVGCGVLASACGMDKVVMKTLFREADLPMCKYLWFLRGEWDKNPKQILRRVKKEIGFPCFVKPANLGSSVGISQAVDQKSLEGSINLAARFDRKIIIEEGLDVREVECAVLGNEEVEASLPGEYMVHDEQAKFLDYTEKYASTGHVEFVVPAPLSKSIQRRVQQLAVRAFKSIDGAGLARVDFFIRRDTGELLINELNTMPGLTEVSGYPQMWDASGKPFPQVIEKLIELALERHRDKARNETSI